MAEDVEGNSPSSSGIEDRDFELMPEQLVDDVDDEKTIEEDELLESADDDEIDDLAKEGELPIEELLAQYGYNKDTDAVGSISESSYDSSDVDKPASELRTAEYNADGGLLTSDDNDDLGSDDDDDDDTEFRPLWKKEVRVGREHQAQVPEFTKQGVLVPGSGCCSADTSTSEEDRLLWDPECVDESSVVDCLKLANRKRTDNTLPRGCHTWDDEEVLYGLMTCKRGGKTLSADILDAQEWTEEDCQAFESGIKSFGKNFSLIRKHKLPLKTTNELVQFYYLWKKTERRDLFIDYLKRKMLPTPGHADYMERFLGESYEDHVPYPYPNMVDSTEFGMSLLQRRVVKLDAVSAATSVSNTAGGVASSGFPSSTGPPEGSGKIAIGQPTSMSELDCSDTSSHATLSGRVLKRMPSSEEEVSSSSNAKRSKCTLIADISDEISSSGVISNDHPSSSYTQ